MRHVPIAIYIDTECYFRNNLNLDAPVFQEFRETFVKEGFRLLVPEVMERELFRHFNRRATETAASVVKAHSKFPANKLATIDLPSEEDLKKDMLREMMVAWEAWTSHFVVEKLPAVGCIEDVLNWYFEISPPFSEKKSKEFPDAFIISVLDKYHRETHANIAVVGKDVDFKSACLSRRYVAYFEGLDNYIKAFQDPEKSKGNRSESEVDLFKPVVTEDLSEMKAILSRGSDVTSIEIDRVMSLLAVRGSNYDYFFQNAEEALWIEPLSDAGFFLSPPEIQTQADGKVLASSWPPAEYLNRVFESASEEVVHVLSAIPASDNFRVNESLLRLLVKAESPEIIKGNIRFIDSYLQNPVLGHEHIIELLSRRFTASPEFLDIIEPMLLKTIGFLEDPNVGEKRKQRLEDPEAWGTSLSPIPRFDAWEYHEILSKGVAPLADKEPYLVSRALIDATSSMILKGMHQDEVDSGQADDLSELWCVRLDQSAHNQADPREALVQTLTYACERVYEHAPESIDALNQSLSIQRWKLFRRLRQHLYAKYPSEKTLPWIREQIFSHVDYSEREYRYEFQVMVRRASEEIGDHLLSVEELRKIVDLIKSGPSKDEFRDWMGDNFTEAAFENRRRHFHLKQLRPFANLLSGEDKEYFDELAAEEGGDPVTDDSYSPYKIGRARWISAKSPKSVEDLEGMSDQNLLEYLNAWDNQHRMEEDWAVEVNFSALADAFQSVFKEQILTDSERMGVWVEHRDEIRRPIYVGAMLKAMNESVKEGVVDNLPQCFGFCEWVLSHPDPILSEEAANPREDSVETPNWSGPRREVVRLIEESVKKESQVPLEYRDYLIGLLRTICTQPDARLDSKRTILLNKDDPVTEAINSTRSHAIEVLIKVGDWVLLQQEEDPISDIFGILDERVSEDPEIPLTRPEYAILGLLFGRLCNVNQGWTSEKLGILYPRGNEDFWRVSFSSYIKWNHPFQPAFEILRDEFVYALDNLQVLEGAEDEEKEVVDRVGQHLFSYYLWGIYPLQGVESLLETFYEKTRHDYRNWARLFNHVGLGLMNSGPSLAEGLSNRIMAFFDWRLQVAEAEELIEFRSWLEAECMDAKWRLESFSKVLDLRKGQHRRHHLEIRPLRKLLESYRDLVVECFAKITDGLDADSQMYISKKHAGPILHAGLQAEDPVVRENAERAREKLLKLGRFDFLDGEE